MAIRVERTGEAAIGTLQIPARRMTPSTPAVRMRSGSTAVWLDDRQMRRILAIGFLLLLVPASIARLTGWRWRPWPSGPDGYGSVISEAKAAANTYVPFAFMG